MKTSAITRREDKEKAKTLMNKTEYQEFYENNRPNLFNTVNFNEFNSVNNQNKIQN
jgi:hypothetical protein